MDTKIFTRDEIYDLVSAQHSALELEKELNSHFGWYDFSSKYEYEDKFELIANKEDKFNKLLIQAAIETSFEFETLLYLSSNDFVDEEEFWEERNIIQENITDIAVEILSDFCID